MKIQELAELIRVKCCRDVCGDWMIPGKSGDIYEDGDKFSILAMFKSRRRLKNFDEFVSHFAIRKQSGDTEAVYVSNSLDLVFETQPNAIDKLCKFLKIRRKQILTDSERERRREQGRILAKSQ